MPSVRPLRLPDALPLVDVRRQLSDADANKMIGQAVPDLEPNITEAGLYRDEETGEPLFIYAPYPGDITPLRQAVLRVGFTTTKRASGMVNVSRTFGMSPKRVTHGRESCRATSLATDQPDEHAHIVQAARDLSVWFDSLLPEQAREDRLQSGDIDDEWRMADETVWTSGVINKTSALPYHRDRMNFDVWSAMPVLRRGVRGGCLNIPGHEATLACRDGWVAVFPGYRLVHGVTPMRLVQPDGYRYSIVYYALRGMKDCFSYAAGLEAGRKARTQREAEMVKQLTGEMAPKVS